MAQITEEQILIAKIAAQLIIHEVTEIDEEEILRSVRNAQDIINAAKEE